MLEREGFDGTELLTRKRILSGSRESEFRQRALPGTFEHRYGGAKKDTPEVSFYEGGVRFALLCERCGHDAPYTVDWSRVGTTQWTGGSPARLEAMEELTQLIRYFGKTNRLVSRLTSYCVEGKTSKQIAKMYRRSQREMAVQLELDLARVAIYFGYAPRR